MSEIEQFASESTILIRSCYNTVDDITGIVSEADEHTRERFDRMEEILSVNLSILNKNADLIGEISQATKRP